MIFHLNRAVVHIESCVWLKPGSADHFLDHFRMSPEGRGKCSCTGEILVVLGDRIKAHQSAHGAAGDEGVFPTRQGRIFAVNFPFEGTDQPVHGNLSATFDIAADTVILSTGYRPAPLTEKGRNVHLVGDCSKVGNLRTVIWQAWDVAMKL
mgnify:CR=1 FL=1